MTITKEAFFKPEKAPTQNKASTTDSAAKQIIAVEAAQRARKPHGCVSCGKRKKPYQSLRQHPVEKVMISDTCSPQVLVLARN